MPISLTNKKKMKNALFITIIIFILLTGSGIKSNGKQSTGSK